MSTNFCKFARYGVYYIPMQVDIVRNKRMVAYGVYCVTYRIFRIMEAFKPMVKVYSTASNRFYHIPFYATA